MEDILSQLNTFKSSVFGPTPMRSVDKNDLSIIVSETVPYIKSDSPQEKSMSSPNPMIKSAEVLNY